MQAEVRAATYAPAPPTMPPLPPLPNPVALLLPSLCPRWFSADEVEVPLATHLDVILYSRDQLVQEYADMPEAKVGGGQARGDEKMGWSHGRRGRLAGVSRVGGRE